MTAAGCGLGRASAEILAREGAIVVVSDLGLERAQAPVTRITGGGRATAMSAVVADGAANGARRRALRHPRQRAGPGLGDTPLDKPFMRQMGGREALEKYLRPEIPMGR